MTDTKTINEITDLDWAETAPAHRWMAVLPIIRHVNVVADVEHVSDAWRYQIYVCDEGGNPDDLVILTNEDFDTPSGTAQEMKQAVGKLPLEAVKVKIQEKEGIIQ